MSLLARMESAAEKEAIGSMFSLPACFSLFATGASDAARIQSASLEML
jgi:hypothetical protein